MRWQRSALSEANIMAYDGYGMPNVEFSPLSRLPDTYEAGVAARRQRDLQDSMIASAMLGCMARNGYITQR